MPPQQTIPQMLEYVKHLPVKRYCGRYAWLNTDTGETSVFFCGLASCGRVYCQRLYYLKRVRLISDLIREYDLSRFLTLTMGHKLARCDAWGTMPHVWNKARTMMVRKHPGLQYCTILEAHKDGYPHLHGFVSHYIRQREWSNTFAACGGGSYAWIERVEVVDGDVGRYVTKQLNIARYVGKEQVITARQMVKPRARTFWRSQGMKTEYEQTRQAAKSSAILVTEDIYHQTEKGFDKRAEVVYSKSIGQWVVRMTSQPSVKE